ncbi:MAG TPA: hypothetical protein VI911_08310 [Patescibacteria group bacterium]|nr:hypothetical protein [Patescibacteria group bacterium]
MCIFKKKQRSDYKKSLELIKKVKKVYNSCVTLEQLVVADKYAALALKQLLKVLPDHSVASYEASFKRMHMNRYSSNLLIV